MAVQSKCTINHFEGLNAIESAFSIPFSHVRNSGHMKALPAYAKFFKTSSKEVKKTH